MVDRSTGCCVLALAVCGLAVPVSAERIENSVAVFAALDKVTATIKKLEVPLGETRVYGALKVTPRACFSRPATEQPKTTSFVEVDETLLDGQQKRIFTGWMFAESPGLNALEHPVLDIWLTGCVGPVKAQAQAGEDKAGGGAAPAGEPAAGEPRRRVRR